MKKFSLIFPLALLLLTFTKVYSQSTATTVTTSFSFTGNANYGILFNVQNSNSYPIVITEISPYFYVGGSNSVEVDYNPSPVNSTGATWTQGNVGAGYNGWVLGYSRTATYAAGAVSPISTGGAMSITIPPNSTYGICVSVNVASGIGYSSSISSGLTIASAGGVSIVTGDNIGWSVAALPSPGSSYPRGYVGSISFIATAPPYPPLAGFAYGIASDTVWLNSPYIFVNTSNNAISSFWDITGYSTTYSGTYTSYTPPSTNPRQCAARWNTCYLDTVDYNFTWKFTQVGYYKLKLKVKNLIMVNGLFMDGVDSITKTIVCAAPTQKPVASFFSLNRSVGFTDQLSYYDLSTNGPTKWSWYLNPTYYGVNTFAGYPLPNSWYSRQGAPADTTTQNPYLYALDGGLFDVCLAAGNALGWDTLCRHNYLMVNNGYMMCNGSDSVSFLSTGYVYDQGGPTGNYSGVATGACPAGFRIAACADSIQLDIERFKLASGDTLTISVGSATGTIIKKLGGQFLPDSLKHYRIPGGFVFFQMTTQATSTDSGFAIHWTALPASYGKPKASFTMTTNGPTTAGIASVYKGYVVNYTSSSTGINVSYSWDTNGDGIYGSSAGGDSITANPSWITNNLGLYTICVRVSNCIGMDSACKQIRVIAIPSRPTADMTVNRTTGFTTDTIMFYDASTNGAMSWLWTFSPTTVTYLNGTSATSQNPVVFLNSAICYTVTLTATNVLGSSTKIIPCMVNIVGYNSPGSKGAIPMGSDIGISRVTLGSIDTTTDLQTPTYLNLSDIKKTTLFKGLNYILTTYRLTNNDPMTTKVWIDYNMNSQFTDTLETIISEKSKYKIATSQTFRIPDNNRTGNTRMRVGITYDSTVLTPDRADLGRFEDYGIIVGIDYVKPVLTLVGSSVYKMQVGKHYTELGVTAYDNLEGNISSKYVRTGFLDTNTVGYYSLTYTVADLYGNISLPKTRIIQVEIDQIGPTIALIGSDTVRVGVKYNYTEQGATAADNIGRNISNLITISGTVNTSLLGIYPLTYSITDAYGFTASKIRTVMVVDTTKPVIVSKNGKTITDTIRYQINTQFSDQNLLSAQDNYDTYVALIRTGTVNVNVKGYYTLLYNATDASGNHANPFRLVIQIDNTIMPVITLVGSSNLIADVNTNYSEPGGGLGVNYSSTYYTNIGYLVLSTTSNLDMTKLGTYNINYCVTDPSQNKSCVTRNVQVVDRIAPVISLLGDDPYNLPRYQPYVDPGVTISDNYYTEVQLKPFLKSHPEIVKNDVPGLYYVTYDITDLSGNIADQVVRTVKVIDKFGGVNSVNTIDKIKIYPNPSTGKFIIDNENGIVIQTVKVYSIIGSLVKEIKVNKNSKNIDVDMTGVEVGIYIVKTESAEGSFTQKINIVK